jgi:hypothetical protein
MKVWLKNIKVVLTIFFVLAIFLFFKPFLSQRVFAGIYLDPHPACEPVTPACWEDIKFNEWSCQSCPSGKWGWRCILDWSKGECDPNPPPGELDVCQWWACSDDIDKICLGPLDDLTCQPYGYCMNWPIRYDGPCTWVCTEPLEQDPCYVFETMAECNALSPATCLWIGQQSTCEWREDDTCVVTLSPETRSCCGPGTGVPTPTPTSPPPTPTPEVCGISGPSNLFATNITETSAVLNWTPGWNGGEPFEHRLRVGESLNEVNADCDGSTGETACVIKREGLSFGKRSFNIAVEEAFNGSGTPAVLSPDTLYYFRVIAFEDPTCWADAVSSFTTLPAICAAPLNLAGDPTCDGVDGLLDITWSWGVVAGATQYHLQVDTVSTFESVNLQEFYPFVNSQSMTNLTPGTWYARVRVLTANPAVCTAPSVWSGTASVTQTCLGSIEGYVFDDPYGEAYLSGGICTHPGSPGAVANSGSVEVDGVGGPWSGTVDGSGNYSVANVPILNDAYTATFTPASPWICMCPAADPGNPGSCLPYSSIDSPQSGVDFYISQVREGWFQTIGGDVHAQGNIVSEIPDTCAAAPACTAEFSLAGADEVGVVSASGGPGSYGSGDVSSELWEATSTYQGSQFKFGFWRRETETPQSLADCDLTAPPGSSGIYEVICNSDFELSGDWSGISNNITLFVNFDSSARTLTLNPTNGITFPIGSSGLLTLITNGNVQVADTVTQVEGVYVIDGVFRSCVNDDCGYDSGTGTTYQLKVRGSIAAWGGVDLQRDLFVRNVDTPAEEFTYEPDFVELLPEFILRAIYTWQEVAP